MSKNNEEKNDREIFAQALTSHRHGKLDAAAALYEQVILTTPDHFDALHLRATVSLQKKYFSEAIHWIEKALAKYPDDATAHGNLGLALHGLGRLDAALASYDRALLINPHFPEAYYNRGNALRSLDRLQDAVASYERALALRPDYVEAHYNLGNTLLAADQPQLATASFDRVIKLNPNHAEAHNNLGNALQKMMQLKPAVACFDRAIALRPQYAEAYNNRGNTLLELKTPSAALASYDKAILINPDYAEAWSNRGNALIELGRPEDATKNYTRAIELQPVNAEAYSNRGTALLELGECDKAIADFDIALTLHPNDPEVCWNKALGLLLAGDNDNGQFAEGWNLYENRWRKKGCKARDSLAPEWDGHSHVDSLLVLPEQGVGDQIFYAGILAEAATFADKVIACVDPRLVALFDRSFRDFGIRAIAWPDAPKTCTHQIYFASLARHFRSDNSAFVRVRSPYLKVCSRRSAELRHRIAPPGKLVCGLSWLSKNDAIGARKSLSLNSLLPLLQLPDTVFINLQYGNTQEEQAHLKEDQGLELINIQEIDNFNDLDGLAALIEACDVVVTVSNTTAHLAGALGKPVYLILPNGSGLLWYWHLKRSDNPWYPSMHIYRGKSSGDHAEWLQCLRNDLAKLHNPET